MGLLGDLKTRVVLDALDMALAPRKPDNVIHHSDQRIPIHVDCFRHRCREAGVRPSIDQLVMLTTMRCARVSSQPSNAS